MSARNNPPGWRDDGTCPGWPTQKERDAHDGLWMIRMHYGLITSGKLVVDDGFTWLIPFCRCHGYIESEGCEVWPIDEHGQRITIKTDDQQGG
jgi:hypothetical protein